MSKIYNDIVIYNPACMVIQHFGFLKSGGYAISLFILTAKISEREDADVYLCIHLSIHIMYEMCLFPTGKGTSFFVGLRGKI